MDPRDQLVRFLVLSRIGGLATPDRIELVDGRWVISWNNNPSQFIVGSDLTLKEVTANARRTQHSIPG